MVKNGAFTKTHYHRTQFSQAQYLTVRRIAWDKQLCDKQDPLIDILRLYGI